MPPKEIIGLRSRSDECRICKVDTNWENPLNEITMDLILSRKAAEEIITATTNYFGRDGEPLTREELAIHAEHCDPSMVPDDYILHPLKYENGEKVRYQAALKRAEAKDEDA